jgi:hypothetical protein
MWLVSSILTGFAIAFVVLVTQQYAVRTKTPGIMIKSPIPLNQLVERNNVVDSVPTTKEQNLKKQNNPIETLNTKEKIKDNSQKEAAAQAKPIPKVNHQLNRKTNNYNILFLGVNKQELLMCSVYTINIEGNKQASSIFLPTKAFIPGRQQTLSQYYQRAGTESVKKLLEQKMGIKIAYYVLIEKNIFFQVEKIIKPIYVNDEKVALDNLFTKQVGPEDPLILGGLMERFMDPKVYFGKLPELILTAKHNIKTDFKVTPKSLLFHYRLAKKIDTQEIKKLVLPTEKVRQKGQDITQISVYALENAIYEMTH